MAAPSCLPWSCPLLRLKQPCPHCWWPKWNWSGFWNDGWLQSATADTVLQVLLVIVDGLRWSRGCFRTAHWDHPYCQIWFKSWITEERVCWQGRVQLLFKLLKRSGGKDRFPVAESCRASLKRYIGRSAALPWALWESAPNHRQYNDNSLFLERFQNHILSVSGYPQVSPYFSGNFCPRLIYSHLNRTRKFIYQQNPKENEN